MGLPSSPIRAGGSGGRAPAAGLCARPGKLRGPINRTLGGPGWGPKISPNQTFRVRAVLFFLFCSTLERGLITAPPVPGTSYPIAGVRGAGIWCSVQEASALPRASCLAAARLLRPCIKLPAAGASFIHPFSSPSRAPTALLGEHPSLLFQSLPQ